jgi:hypothetical protein
LQVAPVQSFVMDDTTRSTRSGRICKPQQGPDDPAVVALLELIQSERARAALEESVLVEQADPGRAWLLWFAIGATDAVCSLVQREADGEKDRIFRQVVSVIFRGEGVRSGVDPVKADRRLRSSTARAVIPASRDRASG